MATANQERDTEDDGAGGSARGNAAPAEQARTRLARAAVAEAARSLFLDRGYAATTFDMISAESGVPAPTIYRLFQSKSGLLRVLIDEAVTGDGDPVPLEHREKVQGLLASADPRRQLAGLAGIVRDVNGRATRQYPLLVSAADSDSGAAALLAEYNQQRQHGQGLFARSLAEMGALRPGMTERDAADIIHAMASPETYRLLVGDRGWSPDRFERWLTSTLCELLISPPKGHPNDER